MPANVMMDLIDPSIVPIDGGQTPMHVVPFLALLPWNILHVATMVQVCHNIKQHRIKTVRKHVKLENRQGAYNHHHC